MQQNKNNKLLIPENLESEQFIHCSWVLETTLELQRSRFIWDTFENLTSYFGNLEPKRKRYEKLMRKSLGNIFDFFIEKNDYDAMNPKSCCFEDFKIIVKGFGIKMVQVVSADFICVFYRAALIIQPLNFRKTGHN